MEGTAPGFGTAIIVPPAVWVQRAQGLARPTYCPLPAKSGSVVATAWIWPVLRWIVADPSVAGPVRRRSIVVESTVTWRRVGANGIFNNACTHVFG
jgi:hypothetical protein